MDILKNWTNYLKENKKNLSGAGKHIDLPDSKSNLLLLNYIVHKIETTKEKVIEIQSQIKKIQKLADEMTFEKLMQKRRMLGEI